MYIHDSTIEFIGTNFAGGFYTINQIIDSSHCTLTTSPTPSGAGSGGFGEIAGAAWTAGWAGTITCAQNSTHVFNPGGTYDMPFRTDMVGHTFRVWGGGGGIPVLGTNFVGSDYTFQTYVSATEAILGRGYVDNRPAGTLPARASADV